MSELKRAPITTISEGSKEKSGSIRLDLRLFEPTLVEFPEFNYQTLIHNEKKKRKKLSKINGFGPNDPFDNDDDVEKIAKELEKKYGTNSSYTKKRSGRIPGEICDKGAGYDESDSFIDNTEAYDELIPDEIETVRGGFYINSGPLEFQHLSNYERPEDAQRMPKPKKRTLSTSSSSSDENDDRGTKGDGAKNGHQEKNKIKTGDGKVARKIPKLVSGGEKRNEPPPKVKTDPQDKERLLKTTTVKDMLRAKRDNARNMQEAAQKDGDGVDLSSAPMTSESSNESTAIDMANGVKPEPKLPPNLNEELLRNIILLKEVVKVSTSMGKTIFSDAKVQDLLLKIENATRSAGGHARNQVYSYLAAHLPCTKQTLMLHAKKMRIQQEEARVDKAVARLKRGIDDAMPGALEAYKKEYERVVQLKSSMAIMGIPENENDPKMPKKQFIWTDVTRGLLNSVITTCQATFSTIKSRKVTFEDYIADCLTTKVLPIWPQGWMKMEGLLKEMDVKGRVPNKEVETKIPPIATKPHVEKLDAKPSTTTIPPPVATTSFACSSSLTITPVSSNAPPAKPLPSVQNKVTITNVDKPALPAVVAPHLPSGLSISLTSSNSPTPPPTQSATKSAPRSPPKEATPPPKKSFDYSISSIISSTSSALPAAPTVKVEPERSAMDEKVKVKNEPIATQVIKNRPTPSVVVPEKTTNAIIEELSSTTSETDSDSDSSSDCEIIENSPNAKKKNMPAPPSKTTIIRPPKASSSSAAAQIKRELDPLSLTSDNDIDVNQIMKELKELQEFQQVNSRAASGYTGKKTSESSEFSIGTLDAARLNELKRNLSTQQLVNHHPQLQDEMIFHEITEAVISSVRK